MTIGSHHTITSAQDREARGGGHLASFPDPYACVTHPLHSCFAAQEGPSDECEPLDPDLPDDESEQHPDYLATLSTCVVCESPVQWRERSGGGGEWVHTGGPAMHRAVPQPNHPMAGA